MDWPENVNDSSPIVLLLHGLQGSIRSGYIRGLFHACEKEGLTPAVMHFRGCGGKPNRKPRAYHSGDTGDFAEFITALQRRFPRRPICALGVSLGGNALLKWLGETGNENPLTCAVAISVPFDLDAAGVKLESGLSRIYQYYLIRSLKKAAQRKMEAGFAIEGLTPEKLSGLKTFRHFDDHVTAPLHQFENADDYYRKCSSWRFLKRIGRPTLILHAADDPFLPASAIPSEESLSEWIRMEISDSGGHGGFVEGSTPFSARFSSS